MSNKTNIEEDIKILKDVTNQDFNNPMGWTGYYDSELKELQQAIENILTDRERLLEDIEIQKDNYKILNENVSIIAKELDLKEDATIDEIYTAIRILKIEKPKFKTIEEKKKLLTEEEKEYIKTYTKFNNIKYEKLRVFRAGIEFVNGNNSITCYINTLKKFEALKFGQFYKKEELEL